MQMFWLSQVIRGIFLVGELGLVLLTAAAEFATFVCEKGRERTCKLRQLSPINFGGVCELISEGAVASVRRGPKAGDIKFLALGGHLSFPALQSRLTAEPLGDQRHGGKHEYQEKSSGDAAAANCSGLVRKSLFKIVR